MALQGILSRRYPNEHSVGTCNSGLFHVAVASQRLFSHLLVLPDNHLFVMNPSQPGCHWPQRAKPRKWDTNILRLCQPVDQLFDAQDVRSGVTSYGLDWVTTLTTTLTPTKAMTKTTMLMKTMTTGMQ
ncbi:hypothetical protein H4582DRAFT_2056385 [Lactarius indigo]|nr:hypothetical protein H4582DRAFT_2056385 [Lactarius indigo]